METTELVTAREEHMLAAWKIAHGHNCH